MEAAATRDNNPISERIAAGTARVWRPYSVTARR